MQQWNMDQFSAVIPISSASLGKAEFLKVKRKNLCAGDAIMRKAGWRQAMAGEL